MVSFLDINPRAERQPNAHSVSRPRPTRTTTVEISAQAAQLCGSATCRVGRAHPCRRFTKRSASLATTTSEPAKPTEQNRVMSLGDDLPFCHLRPQVYGSFRDTAGSRRSYVRCLLGHEAAGRRVELRRTMRASLQGKIAIVTGAASGIGAASLRPACARVFITFARSLSVSFSATSAGSRRPW